MQARTGNASGRPVVVRSVVALGAASCLAAAMSLASMADEPKEKAMDREKSVPAVGGKRAVEPAAPILPGDLVTALQEGRFADAQTTLAGLRDAANDDDERGYLSLVLGIAQRLDDKADAARKTLRAALDAAPKGRWAAKLRLELASLEIAARNFPEAETLARAEAEILLAGDRKDRLAEVYYAFARKLLKPDDPVTPADPRGAFDLLSQARNLAKGEALRGKLLFAMARAAQQLNPASNLPPQPPQVQQAQKGRAQPIGPPPSPIEYFQQYLKEYPKGEDRLEARYQLGLAQQAAGQRLPARLTWTDLARDLDTPEKRTAKDADAVRARALYGIALTYGVPNPPDDTSLNLGVAALRRYLAAYQAHSGAVNAAYMIGQSYLARGKSEDALAAFTSFLKGEGYKAESDEARRDLADLSMAAAFQAGVILQGQQKFDEAIAAFKGYLAKYPNGPQSADAQRAIVDVQLLIAADHLRREQYNEARAAWQAFVTQNPLDARVPQILFQIGESFETEKQYDRAVAAWEPLLSRFPGSEPAAHAQFAIASIDETQKGDLEGAIDRFKKVTVEPWLSQARTRISVMESRALTVITPRVYRSGETPQLKITTRNLEKLTFSAYKLNAESYFRKKRQLRDVESLDISLVAADAEWTVDVPKYGRYKPIETSYDLPKLDVPGVYVVKVTDEKHLQATTLVVGSDVDAIVKTSRDQILVFAQDMKTGKGRAGARVLVAQGEEVVLEAKTGEDGVLLKSWDMPRDLGSSLEYLVIDDKNVAGSSLAVPATAAQGLTARAYIYTDRPAYRPGQQVAVRGIVREVNESQYANAPGAEYKLEVTDARGRQIVSRPVTLSEFGTFHETLPLDSGAPVGAYDVHLYQPGKSDFHGRFEVQSYQLQKLSLAFDLKKPVVFRGEVVKGEIVARYQYGAPAANRPINVALPDGRTLHGSTDEAGKYAFEFPTEGFAEEQTLSLAAQLPQDGVATSAGVVLAIRAFSTTVSTTRDVYLDGESFTVNVTTRDAQGEPTGQELLAVLLKQVTQAGTTTEREVTRKTVKTDAKTGKASLSLKADDEQGGTYIVRVSGTDQFGNPVVADRALTISGKKDDVRLRLLADRQAYKVGEEASVNLHSRGKPGPALLTWEADRILSYKIVALSEGDNAVKWPVDGPQFPNFTLTAARMAGESFHEARLDLRVERDLRVTITPRKPTVGPGDEVEFDVTTVDQLGRPVAAEVSVALVDQSLLQQFGDRQQPIGPFFYDQTRTGAFQTSSTSPFLYTPETEPVAEAVVEDAEAQAALTANAAERGAVTDRARRQLAASDMPAAPMAPAMVMPAPAPAAAAPEGMPGLMAEGRTAGGVAFGYDAAAAGKPMAGMMGGMGGGMGGMGGRDANNFSEMAKSEQDFGALKDQESDLKRKDMSLGLRLARAFNPSDKAAKADAQPRERFVETAYWNPSVVTDKDGKARVAFRAPMALSEYQFTARGVTGADTLVGQTTAALTVRKDFFVDLKTPASLTQGDKPRFIGQVHHVGIKGKAELKLSVYAGDREQVFPKTIELKGDGVDEVLFDPSEIPDGDVARLTLTAKAGEASDELVTEVPIRPWGVQAFASASGKSSDDATVFVGLPPGRTYEDPEMLVVVSPTLQRLLIELAVGRDFYTFSPRIDSCIFPPQPPTTIDRASDLLAATSVLSYLRSTRAASAAPEAKRLSERIQGLVSELTSLQKDDGGWPWVGGEFAPNRNNVSSDRAATARVVWALSSAEPLGMLTDKNALEKAAGYLLQQYAKIGPGDHESRAMVLHALSTRGKAGFEAANSLNRLRASLSDPALAYLALAFANLERPQIAAEILDVLAPRAKTEIPAPGVRPRRYWSGAAASPLHRSAAETTALVALAFAKARPQADELQGAVDWMLAHRQGFGWQPHKAKGPALAALAGFYARAGAAEDRYRLVVTVNDKEVYRAEIAGATEGKAVLVPHDALKAGDRNRVSFHIEGRGTYGYSVSLTGFTRDFGPDQSQANRTALINRRVYLPADPELDGKTLPTGFGVAVNAQTFENKATQVALGGRARVQIDAYRVVPNNQPEWERDFLVVEEHLPAGTTLIEGSLQSSASSHTLADGVLTLYFAPDQWPGPIRYDVYGYLPGSYRALPPSVRSVYDPGRSHLGPAGDLKVLSPGEKSNDPYKATPDELYARGKAHFDAGRLSEAAGPLEELFNAYTLRDDVSKDAARMLLLINIKEYDARRVVQYFEVVKEKAPELVLTFDDLLVIGRAYRDIKEYERAYLVWRGVVDASYLEDAGVGEVLRQRGKTLDGIAYLLDLWREYPDTPSIQGDFFALANVLARNAGQAITEPNLRRELAEAGVTRSELLLQSIRLIQTFLALSPKNPLADEASLALVGDFLELEDYPSVVRLSGRYAKIYPKSTFLDSFQYSEALGEFHLGHYDRAVEVAQTISKSTYKDGSGVEQPSPNKWQAIYILGQIFDARRQPGKAIEYYKEVAERFTDAGEAVKAFTRKDLSLPEITVVRPPGKKKAKAAADRPEARYPDELKLGFRNIAEADVKVYPVDLMRLYLTRRNLDEIAGIDLAGITPLVETTIELGDGADYADRLRKIDLKLTKEGAYLVMIRGENLYASGILLVTPIDLDVAEEPGGRVRVTARDAATGDLLPKVQVKVIGSANPTFFSGETDLRGVYVAEGVMGEATAVARRGTQYAFFRGTQNLGMETPPVRGKAGNAPADAAAESKVQALEENIRSLNSSNQLRNIEQLEKRYQQNPSQGGAAAGGFR